ncbi:hypothetical protein EHS25_003389 [Saitozyma podzolica]|uniref:Uncharacterized protein n=1 Tax=Saitozyma podzolica TaxID=1890683 RepID=A0A427Y8Q3_9TREE|nr:hypothetical protein EHS25_003389 [Saitozyma podzolica]
MMTNKQQMMREQLDVQLQLLLSEIALAKAQLGYRSPLPSPKSTKDKPQSTSRSLSRFSRFTSTIKRATTRKNSGSGGGYREIEDDRSLLSRRGSDDSDVTLVEGDSAGLLLGVLAPLVSTLQKLGLGLSAVELEADDKLSHSFEAVCGQLEGLLANLREQEKGDRSASEDDFDMPALLLEALRKKVQAERDRLESPNSPTPTRSAPLSAPSLTPSQSQNPFILLPLLSGIADPPGFSYAGFVGGSQSNWRVNNVFRLGSYQASMLFSPSPIAVRRLVTTSPGVKV